LLAGAKSAAKLGGQKGKRMFRDPTVMLHNVVLSLSDSFDLVHPVVADHQQRVAYTALRMAQTFGFDLDLQADVMYAAALHDIGILSVADKMCVLEFDVSDIGRHAEIGSTFLQGFPVFARAAELVQHHHRRWDDEPGWEGVDPRTRLAANIICLADRLDVSTDKDAGILSQVTSVKKKL
jgi:HD-GYP domain-containing protein (c-di-GMP phosphodiesterase class II)